MRTLRAACVVAAAILALPGAVGSTSTQPSVNGRIAFFTGAGIRIVNASGISGRYLPGTAAGTENPVWSPDGTTLLVELPGVGDDTDIAAISGSGRGRRLLTFSRAFDGDPSWAPDGSRIVFESRRSGDPELWRMLPDGRRQEQLTFSPGFDGDPAFSPDGTRLAFTSARDGNRELYTMRIEGSELRRLTFTGGAVASPDVDGVDENPSWSPDGRRILFDSSRDGDLEIYVMNADGSGQVRLTDHPALDARPVWSSDGTRIVFESDRGEKSQPLLYTMTPTGTALRRLTTFAASGVNELGADWQRIGPGPPGCTIWGTRGDDLLTGTPVRDILCGGAGIDRIVGNGGGDRLEGGPGPDQLGGEDGDDTLIGGTGRDRIFGGRGRDRIEARDRAADFVDGGPADDRARADPVDRLWRVEGRL